MWSSLVHLQFRASANDIQSAVFVLGRSVALVIAADETEIRGMDGADCRESRRRANSPPQTIRNEESIRVDTTPPRKKP